MRRGLVAEFTSADAMIAALRRLRELGYRDMDAFTPYPLKEAQEALGLPRSKLTVVVFAFGLLGGALAYLIQWWTNAYDYPLNVGAYPPHSVPSFIPITFETTVLFGALAGFIGLFAACGLPKLWDPLFEVEGFGRASIDRFFVAIDARDPRFDRAGIVEALTGFGALRVEPFGGAR